MKDMTPFPVLETFAFYILFYAFNCDASWHDDFDFSFAVHVISLLPSIYILVVLFCTNAKKER
jgi:hypothetical protein